MMQQAIDKLRGRFGQPDGSLSITVSTKHKSEAEVLTLNLTVTYLYSQIGNTIVLDPINATSLSAFLRRQLEPKIIKAFAKVSESKARLVPGSDLKHLNRIQLMEK